MNQKIIIDNDLKIDEGIYKQCYPTLCAYLANQDPIGLVKKTQNKDEYLSESKIICKMIINDSKILNGRIIRYCSLSLEGVCSIIHAVFISVYGEELAGTRDKYKAMANLTLNLVKDIEKDKFAKI